MMLRKTALLVGAMALAACSSQAETTAKSSVDAAASMEISDDILEPNVPSEPMANQKSTSTPLPRSSSELQRKGDELVRRDMAQRFSDWVMERNHAVWSVDASDELRRKYAVTQNNASVALLAYEDESAHYSNWRALAIQATECRIRSQEWALSIASKLRNAEAKDATLVATSKALSPIERDTGDAFSAFLIDFHLERSKGKDSVDSCRFLASMPFMRTFDRYEAGLIDELPRPISSR